MNICKGTFKISVNRKDTSLYPQKVPGDFKSTACLKITAHNFLFPLIV